MSDSRVMPSVDPVRQEYDRLAPEYDERWRSYIDATLELVLSGLELEGHEQVLDAPCGTGELERRLLACWAGLQIVGVDLSPEMLNRARSKDIGSRVEWLAADVLHLPVADRSFDYAVCANSFHYFPAPLESLRELRRVLRPGGTLVLVDWCDDFLACKLCSWWLRWTDPAFFRTYSLRECETLVIEAGLDVEQTRVARAGWIWGLMKLVCRRGKD